MAKAAQPPAAVPDPAPEEKPTEKPASETPPAEPEKPEDLANKNEGARKQMWTDAIAKIARRITILEEREIAGTVWTIPAIIAISAVVVALIVSFSAIYFVFKGAPSRNT